MGGWVHDFFFGFRYSISLAIQMNNSNMKKKWHYSTTSITYKFQIVDGCRSILSLQVVVDFRFFNRNLPFCLIKIVSNLGECCWGKIIVVQQHILQLISYFALWRGMYFQSTKWISVINNTKELFHPTMTTLFHN